LSSKKKVAGITSERLEAFEAKQKLEASKAKRRKSDNRLAVMVGAGALVLALVGQLAYFSFGPGSVPESTEADPAESSEQVENSDLVPSPSIAESRIWAGSMQVGDATLELELDGVNAPQAVANFLDLSSKGFFEGTSCHRLTTSGIFVLQCGDPSGNGSGGPGYDFGPIENAPLDNVYGEGLLAMARPGFDPALGPRMGSQFFIVYQDSTLSFDAAGGYTVFGKITKGLDQLAPIIEAGVEGGGPDGPPALPTALGAIELR
jgi:peptidyl-prolyl cis-trans isomerase B (cyclophilin B)